MSPRALHVPDLGVRRLEPELMDGPGLAVERHRSALAALGRVNGISLAAGRVWADVRRLHREGRRPVRVLDVACGGGDVLRRVALRAGRGGVPVEVHGCDVSPVALEAARRALAGVRGARFFELDAERDGLPDGYDLMCCSLFLHHLTERSAARLLRDMSVATRRSLLVQDLRRSRFGWVLAWVGLHVLTRSDVARSDGLTSVAGAFTLAEATALARAAGLEGAEIRPCWPQRYTIRWSRP